MPNLMKLMKQAASMQQNMSRVQEELAAREVEFSAGGDAVTAVVRGDLTLARIRIKPAAVCADEVELLEDLVLAAVTGAQQAARELAARELGKVTEGLGLPAGMQLPF